MDKFANLTKLYAGSTVFDSNYHTWVDEIDDLLVVDLHVGHGHLRVRALLRLRLLHPRVQRHHRLERQSGVLQRAEHGVRLARPRGSVHEHGAVVACNENMANKLRDLTSWDLLATWPSSRNLGQSCLKIQSIVHFVGV